MKLVSFNIWGATQGQQFFDYLEQLSGVADIFCFQEVFSAPSESPKVSFGARMHLYEELKEKLKDYTGIFEERSQGHDFKGKVDFEVKHGIAVFVKKGIKVIGSRAVSLGVSVYNLNDPVDGITKMQILELESSGKKVFILNYHGPSQPGEKLDTKERLDISNKILKEIQSLPSGTPVILCGDFNLMPQTESIKMFEPLLKNLIKEFKIENTRNEITWKKYNNKQNFADFMFVSPNIKVINFEVPYNLASDHLPMILDFEI